MTLNLFSSVHPLFTFTPGMSPHTKIIMQYVKQRSCNKVRFNRHTKSDTKLL